MTRDDKFTLAHIFTARWEGGISDHPADRGAYTAYGVSTEFMRDLMAESAGRRFLATLGLTGPVNRELMRKVDREKAASIFRYYFWDAQRLDEYHVTFAIAWYDMAVNHGKAGAGRMLQQACNNRLKSGLKVDGAIGPLSRRAFRRASLPEALEAIRIRKQFFKNLASRNPSQKAFLKGWLNRAKALEEYLTEVSLRFCMN